LTNHFALSPEEQISLYFSKETVARLPPITSSVSDRINFFLLESDGTSTPIRTLKISNDITFVKDIGFGLSVALRDYNLARIIKPHLEAVFNADEAHVFSLFDELSDPETVQALRQASARASTFKNYDNMHTLVTGFKALQEKIAIVIGHIEEQDLVVRDASNSLIARLPADTLREIANDNKIALILLGCETAKIPGITGLSLQVSSFEVAGQLHSALRARTIGEFLETLTPSGMRLVVDNAFDSELGSIIRARLVLASDTPTIGQGIAPSILQVAVVLQPRTKAIEAATTSSLRDWSEAMVCLLVIICIAGIMPARIYDAVNAWVAEMIGEAWEDEAFGVVALILLIYSPWLGLTLTKRGLLFLCVVVLRMRGKMLECTTKLRERRSV
jgi:hypothetical protein